MEEIKAYIESGVLELYAMGELSPAEKHEVETMAAKHPAIEAELAEIQQALEGYAEAYAIAPADQLRERVLSSLFIEKGTITANNEANNEKALVKRPEVIALPRRKENLFYKYAFAACLALWLMSIAAVFVLYTRLQDSNQQLATLEAANQKFANRVNFMDQQLNSSKEALAVLRNPDYRLITLAGTPKAPKSSMAVAWNPQKQEVLLDIAALNLPVNDKDHQYQLWALVDGKPVDLGVFDMVTDSVGLKRMKNIGKVDAFAVTLEPRGGSVSPTLEEMVAMGAI